MLQRYNIEGDRGIGDVETPGQRSLRLQQVW
jgi:hypothetical protein